MMRERSDKFANEHSIFGSVAWCMYYVLVLFVVLTYGQPSGPDPIIHTKWGPIRGKWSRSINDRPIASFLGIPYALPPLGDLRFKSPQRWNRTWTKIRDSTVDGQMCTQLSGSEVIGGEDCLFLNVFMPMIPGNQSAKWPVMVYVYGGKFLIGSSDSTQYAPEYLLNHDVVLVTLNYRLNVLGFFSTTNRVTPGNYGLKDIIAALHWVQENIDRFQGNPESVTMMGSSAGSASIHFLAFSNKSKGLFHRYILHSGTALHQWAFHPRKKYRQICLELARMVGCLPTAAVSNKTIFANSGKESGQYGGMYDPSANNVEQDENMMKCMRTVNASEILKMTKMEKFYIWRSQPSCFISPILEEDSEDAIVTMHPLKVLKNGLFRDMPAILQVTQDEGLVKSIDFILNSNIIREFIQNFEQYLPSLTEYQDMISNTSAFADAIQDFYFNGRLRESDGHLLDNITEMMGDALMTWPSFRTVQYQSQMGNASVYFSLFAYQGTFSWTFRSGSPYLYGVNHADDINYFFPVLNKMFEGRMLHNTENDRTMISIMTEIWTNFAKDGVPRAWMIPAWPDYRDHHRFMRFGLDVSPDIAVQTDFLSARMEFWEKLMANVSTEFDMEPSDGRSQLRNDNTKVNTIASTVDHRLALDAILAIALVSALI